MKHFCAFWEFLVGEPDFNIQVCVMCVCCVCCVCVWLVVSPGRFECCTDCLTVYIGPCLSRDTCTVTLSEQYMCTHSQGHNTAMNRARILARLLILQSVGRMVIKNIMASNAVAWLNNVTLRFFGLVEQRYTHEFLI